MCWGLWLTRYLIYGKKICVRILLFLCGEKRGEKYVEYETGEHTTPRGFKNKGNFFKTNYRTRVAEGEKKVRMHNIWTDATHRESKHRLLYFVVL